MRVRAKTRVPGGSLGRSFSRSCAGLIGISSEKERMNLAARRASFRVRTLPFIMDNLFVITNIILFAFTTQHHLFISYYPILVL